MRTHHPLFAFALAACALVAASPLAHAAGADPTTANAATKQRAQTHFSRAHDLFARGQFRRALDEARASHDAVASPNARLLVARCLRELGELPSAYAEYTGAIDEANALAVKEARYAATAQAAVEERSTLEPKIARITVEVVHPTEDAKVTIGGQPLPRESWSRPIAEAPGSLAVALEVGGKEVAVQNVMVLAGESKTATLDASPAPTAPPAAVALTPPAAGPAETAEEPPKSAATEAQPPVATGHADLKPYAYAAGGVGAAGLLLFAIFGAMDNSTYSSLQQSCPGNVCPPGKAGDISAGKTDQVVADVALGFGIAGVAAGATLLAIDLSHGKSHAPADTRPAAASLIVSPTFIGVRGAL